MFVCTTADSASQVHSWQDNDLALLLTLLSLPEIYVGDAGNTPLVGAGTPWARRQSLHPGVLVVCFGSAASWRPCNVADPHQGPVTLSRGCKGGPHNPR